MMSDRVKALELINHLLAGGYLLKVSDLKLIRKALSEPEWRDISTAPRDGGPILISNGKWISKAYWSESCQFERFEEKAGWQIYQCEDGFYSVGAEPEEPTHWMPLPSPPKGKTP